MEVIYSFIALSLLVVVGAWIVDRAKRFGDGPDDRRQSLESLAGLCQSGGMTTDEQRSVKEVLEVRLRRL